MKRLLTLLIAVSLLLSVFVGTVVAEEEVYTITVFNSESGEELNNDPIIKFLCDKFGLKFEWISPSWTGNNQTMMMLIAGGETPDMMSSQITPGTVEFQQFIDDGIILDLTDYLASGDYPNLAAYVESQPSFVRHKVDGHWYGIPKLFDGLVPHAFQYRQDWLDKLGLSAPTNMDELYEVLKAVVAADPDGQGTTGITIQGAWWLRHFMMAFTGSVNWTKVDDRWQQYYVLDGYKDFLKYFAKLYAENLLDHDYILEVEGSAQEKFMGGRAFLLNYNIDPAVITITADGLYATYPDAVIGINEPIEGPAGKMVMDQNNDTLGIDLISADCKCPERILALWDYLASPEGHDLIEFGIEGMHYTVDANGNKIRNEEQFAADTANFNGAWGDGYHFAMRLFDYSYSYLVDSNHKYYDIMKKASDIRHAADRVQNQYTYQFTSENQDNFSANVDTVVNEWQAAFINGEKSVDNDWDAYIQELTDAGYYSIEDDFNAWMVDKE